MPKNFKKYSHLNDKKLASLKSTWLHFLKIDSVNKDRTIKTFKVILKQLTFAANCSQIMVYYKCTGEIPDRQTKDKATEVLSRANEDVIKVRSSHVRTSGVIQQQSINKDVSNARQVPEEDSLWAGCCGHGCGKKAMLCLSWANTEPHKLGKFFRLCVR